MVLINPFVKLWIGEQYVLGQSIIICLVLVMYIDGLRLTGITYRETLGLFEKGKLSPFFAAIINIILSIILGKMYGVAGIFLATSISNIMTLVWVDPYLIHKYEFKSSVKKYFKTFVKYIITYFIIYILTYASTMFIEDNGIISFIIKAILVCVIPNLILFVAYRKTNEFIEVKNRIIHIINKKRKIKEID